MYDLLCLSNVRDWMTSKDKNADPFVDIGNGMPEVTHSGSSVYEAFIYSKNLPVMSFYNETDEWIIDRWAPSGRFPNSVTNLRRK